MNNFLLRILTGAGRIVPLLTVFFLLLHASAQAQITGMRAGSGAEYLKSPHVIAKLSRYFEAIRMGFGGKWKSGSAFWEKRLEALLAGG